MSEYNQTPLQRLITVNSEAKDAIFTAWHLLKDTKSFNKIHPTRFTNTPYYQEKIDKALLFFNKLLEGKIDEVD